MVGGGVAGLAAAHTLRRAGLRVLLLEARDRLGGRVASTKLRAAEPEGDSGSSAAAGQEVVVEAGASWIHRGGGDERHVIGQLAAAQELATHPTDWEEMWVFDDSGWLEDSVTEEAEAAVGALIRKTQEGHAALLEQRRGAGQERADTSLGAALDAALLPWQELTPAERWGLQSEIVDDYAAELSQLSSLHWDADDEYSGTDLLVPGGYDRVFRSILPDADGLSAPPTTLRLNAAVSRIERTESDATVTHSAADGSAPTATTTAADVAIVSLPLGVLKAGRVEFIPPLPSEKREAIEHLGVGLLNKVFVWFEQVNNRHFLRFFESFVVTLPPF